MKDTMIYKTIQTLEYDQILEMLSNNAASDNAKEKLTALRPSLSITTVRAKIKETTDARRILDSLGTPPLPTMKDIKTLLELAEKGSMLTAEQLSFMGQFLSSCNRMKNYLKKSEFLDVDIAYYGKTLQDLTPLLEEINQAIRNDRVDDSASKELKDTRRKIELTKSDIRSKLETMLRSKKDWFSEGFISSRNGHYVLPVKKEYKHQVGGSIMGTSSTGSTCFIVPNAVLKLEEELSLLLIREENEERKILYTLTSLVHEEAASIHLNMEALETLDIVFAKAKLSLDLKAKPAEINDTGNITIINGRHPLLKAKECIPLNFSIGNGTKGIIITGPNTGGKTVALKTVGLLQLMAQSGLHVPCESAEICMTNSILCDIGDGQSISENLSTFSAHITNIIEILRHSDKESLVLLDELGSGTDPAEGMGIAIAILEELRAKGCLFIATTHYPEVKEYAAKTEGFMNARMAFNKESLEPLYKLEIGEAGESCALYIAKRLGLPKHMLQKAYDEAYKKEDEKASLRPIDSLFIEDAIETIDGVAVNHIQKEPVLKPVNERSSRFQLGDSVVVYPQKKIGIVFQPANDKGEVGVQVQKKKELINHKRLKLKASASQLYPPDYDFSILFDTVENRKARHKMGKGHQPDLQINYEEELSWKRSE
ncbi:endonuclease MutS2 [Anaerocolumna cellulosilytica]|uniref:Endonuclease MutS2 n=1 Tax=Anaerocolumna cellulosilytica TaxID=433286 RepID=A0A6S6R0E6_9FIRM|nr:DNA mismatch repair protein MutS [Anaerocolumna cellulosilytica]MBB5196887.1 dsDNA-specific endonuclease/ATPase MutS2 [Anaerocolumna cellulosilytica]BCJ92711.1 endonuclease MutS2 [Anaerocolumna cellulosilytica]